MQYIKEMKVEVIEILLPPMCSKFLKEKEVPAEELQNLNDDDAVKFKELFTQNKVSIAHKGCTKQMDTLFEFVIDILTKRVSVEAPNVKIDQIHGKITLVDIPEGVCTEDYTETIKKPPAEEGGEEIEEKVEHKKNTDEKAVIVLKVPQVEEEEEIQLEVADGEEPKTEIIKKIVDEDQAGSAVVLQGRDVSGIKVVEAK